ncbi:MAG: hypothetical protein ABJE95_38115 [Byssovorax sp.]
MNRLGMISAFGLIFAGSLPFAGCSSEPGTTGATGGSGATTGGATVQPTFHKDIEPILQKSCQSCHTAGRIAPFALTTYDDAKTVASLLVTRTADRTMPPWGAFETETCKPRHAWQDDKRLTDAEIQTIEAWNTAGALEGDPKDAPAKVDPGVDGLPGVETTVTPQTPFVASGDKDQFRCFVLDPKLDKKRYLNGSHFIAGNAKVVHHALMFLDEAGEAAAKADADGGYDCFGGPEISSATLIAAWAPGGVPNQYPANIGLPMAAGSKLVMQIHYHPAGATGAPDATQFQMRFTDVDPDYEAAIALIGNFTKADASGDGLLPGPDDKSGPEFLIPAGARGHTETMRFTVPGGLPELKVYGVATHMHYVGTDMSIQVARKAPTAAQPADECLVETPRWDFNWQRQYAYDTSIETLPTLHAGDQVTFKCTYDNSMENPFVKRALLEQKLTAPQDVTLGETTLDEMCLGAINVIYKVK